MASRCKDGTATGDFLDELPNFHTDSFPELEEYSKKVMKVTVAKNPQHDAILRYAFAVIEFFSSSLEF